MSKINIGKMVCETKNCNNHVTVKQNENGTLSYRCDECDAAPYARTGTGQNETWRSNLFSLTKTDEHNQHKIDLKAEGKAAPLPVKETKPATAFDMWGNPA